jgi:hypothetical protein
MRILLAQQFLTNGIPNDWDLRFSPPWFWGVTVLLGLLAAGLIAWFYLRGTNPIPRRWRIVLALIRLGLVILVLFMLYGATIHPFRVERPTLILLLDNSTSMSLTDGDDARPNATASSAPTESTATPARSRWDRAMAWSVSSNAKRLRQWVSRYRVQIRTLDGKTLSADEDLPQLVRELRRIEPNVPASQLGTAVQTALESQRGRSTAAIVVLTDGNTSEGMTLGEVAAAAARQRIPLFPVGVGRRHPPPDFALTDLLVDRVAFVDDLLTFDVALSASSLEGQSVRVSLRQEGESIELASETAILPPDHRVSRVRLMHRPQQAGRISFVVQADSLAQDSRTDNNALQAVVEVRDESIRVLFIQSVPSFEYRYLNSLLGRQGLQSDKLRDPVVELTTILQESDPEFAESEASVRPAVPWTRDDLRQYDVVIWGDVNPALLSSSSLQVLSDFVNLDGRGLVMIAGPRYGLHDWLDTPLEPLLPFSRSDLSTAWAAGDAGLAQLTAIGRSMPFLQLATDPKENLRVWNQLPPLYWLTPIQRTRPGVRVLATCSPTTRPADSPLPLICLQYVGAGKVVFHATDETYRWRFRQGDVWFGRYWLQMIRFLSRVKLARDESTVLVVDQDRYEEGELVRMRAEFLDDRRAPADTEEIVVLLQDDHGRQRRVLCVRNPTSRGQFEGSVEGLAAGDYRAWIAEPVAAGEPPSCSFTVLPGNRELQHLTMEEQDLRRAAARSGGRFFTLEDSERLTRALPAGRAVRVESLAPVTVWNSWRIASLFVTLLTGEWLLRRWLGTS